ITDDQTPFIDTGSLAVKPQIDYEPPAAEIIEIASGSGLTAEQAAQLQLLKDLAEADEKHTATSIKKLLKGTATELLSKDVSGSSLSGTLAIVEP
ncbi:MAG: hypothetical protein KAU50_08780, partial [Candidatus Marinimicrobia bacterium]|nr:hypothetical protein [Candidatus Neomarinimicrobiota bacterium]